MKSVSPHMRRGSALLIVLGFLTFMMISAVSFAIYMRIERQASSNYRHATTGRHLLNASLCRAIDEIDAELRVQQVTDSSGNVDLRPRKFPAWPGRTKVSAVPNGMDNGNDARVLSLEALSFIPGILVNDVRRYAVSNRADVVKGVNAANQRYSYLGAKWRPISMPVNSIVGGENAYEEAIVGRYAYACVNVSDMFNVNECLAAIRTNGVSLAHLFGADTPAINDARKTFDDDRKTTYHQYLTLQDFYACMYERDALPFLSPYHDYMNAGTDTKGDSGFSPQRGANPSISAHVLVTDGFAKAEPTRAATSVNISDPRYQNPNALSTAVGAFAAQLATVQRLKTTSAGNDTEHFKYMLMDYLDEDSDPYWSSGMGCGALYRPTVEMVPQIFQIVCPKAATLRPIVVTETVNVGGPGPGGSTQTKYKLRLVDPATSGGQINFMIQTMFPFKDWDIRKQKDPSLFNFKADARAFLVLVPSAAADLTTSAIGGRLQSLAPGPLCFELTLNAGQSQLDPMPSDEDAPIVKSTVATFNVPACDVELYTDDSGSITWAAPFAQGMQVRIALVVFTGIKQNNKFVDMAPGYWNPASAVPGDLSAAVSSVGYRGICDRLFYQTMPITLNTPTPTAACAYEWTSLEVPDPRYNHKASNWVQGMRPPAASLNNTLSQQLVGKEGRDNDVYQFVSNAKRLQSVGEFAFLPRPYNDPNKTGNNVALKTNTETALASLEDHRNMFRTVRLYDHTLNPQYPSDDIYNYFTSQSPSGNIQGGRVNPCSDLPQVLNAAVMGLPVNYWVSSLDSSDANDRKIMADNTFNRLMGDSDWKAFTNGWMQCLLNARNVSQYNRLWNVNLSDVYGQLLLFGWHSEAGGQPPDTIFDTAGGFSGTGVPATLSDPLYEIDRKTLFSFSQEAFCDRQQLFIYVLRAEVTVPSFGTTQEAGTRSLAGGRAIAVVWRDPYPVGYSKQNNSWTKGSPTWYNTLNRISPWYQANIKAYNEQHEASRTSDPSFGSQSRLDGYHEHRILYFKQLDN